jgi:lysine 6-dehydrogenase
VGLVHSLVDVGFTGRELIAVNGTQVAPRAVLLALLQKKCQTKTPLDVEALRVVVTGRADKRRVAAAMEMFADHTARPQFSAVARDTGFPAAIAAVMQGRGEIPGVGVCAPENVVPPNPFFGELRKRGFTFRRWNVKT